MLSSETRLGDLQNCKAIAYFSLKVTELVVIYCSSDKELID